MAKKSKLQLKLEARLETLVIEMDQAMEEKDRLNDLIDRLLDERDQLNEYLRDEDVLTEEDVITDPYKA
jgi:predicted  nucleic acid-binding Zn-ribbon protein